MKRENEQNLGTAVGRGCADQIFALQQFIEKCEKLI